MEPSLPATTERAQPAPLSLLVESPSGAGLQVSVTHSPFVMGRLSECDLTLQDSRISRRHARIRTTAESCVVEDLGSRHGITVNGQRVDRAFIGTGDRIGFGVADSYVVTVGAGAEPDAPLLKRVSEISAEPGRTGPLGRLAAMLDVARTMNRAEGVEQVYASVVEAALAITGAERSILLLRSHEGELQIRAARAASGAADVGEPRLTTDALAQALDRRSDLFSLPVSTLTDLISDPDQTVAGVVLGSILCVPILRMRIGQDYETSVISARRDTLGVLYLDTTDPGVRLAEGNQALLQALAIEVSNLFETARLIVEEREKRFLEHDLQIARGIQRSLLPSALPQDGWLVARGHSEPRSLLGGDYYDLMRISPNQWAAVVADVSGKGIAASLLASLLQGAFFLGSGPDASLADTLARINRYVCERSGQTRFVTLFALVVDESGTMRWSNAGHCSALVVRRSGSVEPLRANSRPLGLFEDSEFVEDTCQLEPGDKVLVYSDGVTEARNEAGDLLGEKPVEAAAESFADCRASALFDGLLTRVEDFVGGAPQSDDLTALVLGYKET